MAAPRSVIVFGATGGVGSAAALKAYQEGVKVTLAVRDSSKPIPSLTGISVERVQADLTKPETVQAAVRQSGAKSAFIYAIHGAADGMRSTMEALKEGGIEAVVLLSSFIVQGNIRAIPPSEVVPYLHAKVEIALEDVFGDRCCAVRPGYFSSNTLQYKDPITQGEVRLPNPDIEFDWISPEDIGRVAGTILAHGTQERSVPVLGPERLSLKDVLGLISRILGKQINVTTLGKEEAVEDMKQKGLPEMAAKWFVGSVTSQKSFIWDSPACQDGVVNVQKYTHESPKRLEQWLEENKQKFFS